MDHGGISGDFAIMGGSFIFVLSSLIAISLKDKSWINWYTLQALGVIGTLFVLPVIYMLSAGPTGSFFAYAYCYATYAALSLSYAVGYCCVRPVRLRRGQPASQGSMKTLPWALLMIAFLIYLPVLVAFRHNLTTPREIYANFTAAGFGLEFFVSTTLTLVAFVAFLFSPKKRVASGSIFVGIALGLIYLHGSKGQILSLAFMGILYRVYVMRHKASPKAALVLVVSVTLLAGSLFAFFGSAADVVELINDMAGYADYSRNAMIVIDDPEATLHWGQLELEGEFYSRMPRLLIPDKPRTYGQTRLAFKYFPAIFRLSAGTPSFGIGFVYADFGAGALPVLSILAALTGSLARSLVLSLENTPSPGRFLLLLFFSGIVVIPLGVGYLLPETALIALVLDFFHGQSFRLLKSPGRATYVGESSL